MTVKSLVYTYTPGSPGVVVIRRNSDDYALDATDGTTWALSPAIPVHVPTESIVSPGVFTWNSAGDAWQDDTYRFYWYPDITLAGAPKVWSMTLESDVEPTAGSSIRAELGLAAANLDTQLDAISVLATAGATDMALQSTLESVKAKTDLIVAAGNTTGWTNANTSIPPGGPSIVSNLFDDVREVLHDPEANLYSNTLLLPLYNRAISEINTLLTTLQADVAIMLGSITADGTNYSFALPANFLAPVPQQFKPRSPSTATSNYSWGTRIEHYDRMGTSLVAAPTTVASPTKFYITTTSTAQYVAFDTIPPSGYIYDMLYFTVPGATTIATLTTDTVPWLGFLDSLVSRALEEFAREGKEFTSEKRALWRARAEADISAILGLRHLQSQERVPSLFKTMPRSSEVW